MAIVLNPIESHYRDRHESPVLQIQRGTGVIGARNWGKPANRRPLNQILHRHVMYNLKVFWDNLTIGEKNAWTSFANTWTTTNKYGDTIMISGYNWFLKFNLPLHYNEAPLNSSPPGNPTPTYNPSYIVGGIGPGFPIQVEVSPFPAGFQTILVQRKINLPPTYTKVPLPLKSFGHIDSSDPDPFTVSSASETEYGDRVYWFGFRAFDAQGRAGSYTYVLATP